MGMGSRLSIAARVEITAKYARAYAEASTKDVGRLPDEVVAATAVPVMVISLAFDNGDRFIDYDAIVWAAGKDILVTRSRSDQKNGRVTLEDNNNHLVRRDALYWR